MSETPDARSGKAGVPTAAPSREDRTGAAQPDLFATDGLGPQILAISPDCIKFLSRDGLIQSINEAGRRLLEIDNPAEMLGRPWPLGWPEGARSRAEDAIQSANKGSATRFTEFRRTGKGTPKWWDVVLSPLTRADGSIERLLVIARDITLQKDYEDRVRRSEQQFRALADNIAQFAWLADQNGSIFWYNKRWFQYTGTTLEEMAGWGWQKVHHPDHVNRVVEKIRRHFDSGEPWQDTFPLRAADGSYRWFLSQAMAIRNERDDIIMWCGTNTDITEERRASDRLRQKARLIELSHEAILVWDLAGGIVTWNRGCQELYGYTSEEALGRRTHDLLRTRLPMPAQEFEALLARNRNWSGEVMHVAKDGSEVWVDSRHELVDLGERTLILETNRDITERRRNDEMTQVLLGELDHRVKNTLAIVQSIASQTARRSSDLKSFTTRFDARLQSLARAHNLLTETRWSGASLEQLIRSQFADFAETDRQLRLDGPDVFLPPQVALHLSLVIFELASNARKHGALSVPGGSIEVSWSVNPAAPSRLDLLWRERGGPRVGLPASRGFGTTLIERAGSQPHLTTTLRFMPEGVECRIEADIAPPEGEKAAFFNPRRRQLDAPSGG